MNKFQRVCLFLAIVSSVLLLTACGGWTDQASKVIGVLQLAIPSLLSILAAFGGAIPSTVLDAMNKWGAEAAKTLKDVKALIDDYAADPQASILDQIQAALKALINNLNAILPDLHVTNPTVTRIISLVVSELAALLAFIPVLQNKVSSHREANELHAAILDADEFKREYNAEAARLGQEYTI